MPAADLSKELHADLHAPDRQAADSADSSHDGHDRHPAIGRRGHRDGQQHQRAGREAAGADEPEQPAAVRRWVDRRPDALLQRRTQRVDRRTQLVRLTFVDGEP